MKKRLFVILFVLVALLASTSLAWAVEYVDNVPKDSHKVRNKFDYEGSFVGLSSYGCPGVDSSPIWTYKVHIKEAMDPTLSKGVMHFTTTNAAGEVIDIVGHVEETVTSFQYSGWANWDFLLGAAGTATYNEVPYYFEFLSDENAIWFALSSTPYEGYWNVPSSMVWPPSMRFCQAHSGVETGAYPLDYKAIH